MAIFSPLLVLGNILPLYVADVSYCLKTEAECYFEAGRIIGKQAVKRYEIAVEEPSFKDIMSFCSTPDGIQLREEFLARANSSYPSLVSELEGLAAGSGQPFSTVLTLNLRAELASFIPS